MSVPVFEDPVLLPSRKVGCWDKVGHRINAHRAVCVVCGAGVFREPVPLTRVRFVSLPAVVHVCRGCLLNLVPVAAPRAPEGPYR